MHSFQPLSLLSPTYYHTRYATMGTSILWDCNSALQKPTYISSKQNVSSLSQPDSFSSQCMPSLMGFLAYLSPAAKFKKIKNIFLTSLFFWWIWLAFKIFCLVRKGGDQVCTVDDDNMQFLKNEMSLKNNTLFFLSSYSIPAAT